MRQRKLQVFVSSTYEDLTNERLAAFEAILAAGHIPAAMEQFSPGDETAWEKIKTWIDESDGFILILGGRYGSIEPDSGKSYVQLEYEYALDKKKPFFSIVVNEKQHEKRVRKFGLKVDEREYRDQYRTFRRTVEGRLCAYWNDIRDIKAVIFQKLPEWVQRSDLVGWIRADEAPTAQVLNELAEVSRENRDLRSQLNTSGVTYAGLRFEEIIKVLRMHPISHAAIQELEQAFSQPAPIRIKSPAKLKTLPLSSLRHLGDLFELYMDELSLDKIYRPHKSPAVDELFKNLRALGLAIVLERGAPYRLSEAGLLLRNRLLAVGDTEYRRRKIWDDRATDQSPGKIASATQKQVG